MSAKVELKGQTFGRLKVESFLRTDPVLGQIWLCSCACGRTTEVSSSALRSGNKKSCGCARSKKVTKQDAEKPCAFTVIDPETGEEHWTTPDVICRFDCGKCGWNPAVKEERRRKREERRQK